MNTYESSGWLHGTGPARKSGWSAQRHARAGPAATFVPDAVTGESVPVGAFG